MIANEELKLSDTLAIGRTRMAAERTLMGWIRTSLSLISFGFTIFKFLEAIGQREQAAGILQQESPRTVGLTLISIGLFALVVACLQHWRYTHMLGLAKHYKIVDLSFVIAILIGILGVAMLVSIIFKTGPLG